MSEKFVPRKNTGLGKGLGALIPGAGLTKDGTLHQDQESPVTQIPIHLIKANPFQPRKEFEPQALEELKNSILQNGLIQPITVRRVAHGYELIAGERRFRAARMANLESMPAYIRENVTDEEMLELALIENVQREKLNPIELASGYQQLIDVCRLTQEQVADRIGKDRTTVTNIIRLLKLPARIQDSLKKEEITIGHGRALISLPSEEVQMRAWKDIVKTGMSVRRTEELVKALLEAKGTRKNRSDRKMFEGQDPLVADIESRLRVRFGTKVKVKRRQEGGTVEIEYYSHDDLDRLLELFNA